MEIENCVNSTFNLDYDQYPLSEESVTRVKKKKSEKKKVDAITITTDFAEKYNWGLGTNNVREFTLSEGWVNQAIS